MCLDGAENKKPKCSVWFFLCSSEQSAAVWLGLEYSIELSLNYNADVVILVGDFFNDNQLFPQCRKVKDIMILHNLPSTDK